jgi:translation initiation factor 5A
METRYVEAGRLNKGAYILLEDHPCEVVEIATSKPGKHGSAKVRIVAIGVFDGKKREFLGPADAQVIQPVIVTKTGIVVSISDNVAQIMDNETYETIDVTIPDELKDKVSEGKSVKYIEWGEYRKLTQVFSE